MSIFFASRLFETMTSLYSSLFITIQRRGVWTWLERQFKSGVITINPWGIFDLVLIFGAEKNLVWLIRLKIWQKDQLVGGATCNERDASLNLRLCVFRRLPAIELFSCSWCFIPTDTSHLEDCQNRILQSRFSEFLWESYHSTDFYCRCSWDSSPLGSALYHQ